MDVLQCEGCGKEIPVPANCSNVLVCKACGRVNNKLLFFPLHKTIWVKGPNITVPIFGNIKLPECSCISEYRRAVKFRQAIFSLSESNGQVTTLQAILMLLAFWIDAEEGVLKLLAGSKEDSVVNNAAQNSKTQNIGTELMFGWLAQVQIQRNPGRPEKNNSPVLFMDAFVLSFCPNSYIHLLRDALRLRKSEYQNSDDKNSSAKAKQWTKFHRIRRGVEVSCRRNWKAIFGDNPPFPPDDWWLIVARQQG